MNRPGRGLALLLVAVGAGAAAYVAVRKLKEEPYSVPFPAGQEAAHALRSKNNAKRAYPTPRVDERVRYLM